MELFTSDDVIYVRALVALSKKADRAKAWALLTKCGRDRLSESFVVGAVLIQDAKGVEY